ncbi:hypothetical protein BDV96DRAFT_631956 [Lophiotrema nucula]|uniref:Nephrocystin 3-like N-terminal domain-containing protein n=1 Tax=Lophiotrema nucula TaxID=690887 RepID=A0A6A5Z801_9PLEO|nr:hypothetical protein BDV96DRAFT_631956 [Lophiotrema nucula]
MLQPCCGLFTMEQALRDTAIQAQLRPQESRILLNVMHGLTCRDSKKIDDWLKTFHGPRVDGTCTWILKDPEYLSWRSNKTAHLWIAGEAGMGKTFLANFLKDELSKPIQSIRPKSSRLLYYFCDGQNANESSAASILKSLLHQLYRLDPAKAEVIGAAFRDAPMMLLTTLDVNTLWTFLYSAVEQFHHGTTYCIIDGLDECDAVCKQAMMRLFENCLSRSCPNRAAGLKFIVTSRSQTQPSSFKMLKLEDHHDQIRADFRKCLEAKLNLFDTEGFVEDYDREAVERQLNTTLGSLTGFNFLHLRIILDVVRFRSNRPVALSDIYVRASSEGTDSPGADKETLLILDDCQIPRETKKDGQKVDVAPAGSYSIYRKTLDALPEQHRGRSLALLQMLALTQSPCTLRDLEGSLSIFAKRSTDTDTDPGTETETGIGTGTGRGTNTITGADTDTGTDAATGTSTGTLRPSTTSIREIVGMCFPIVGIFPENAAGQWLNSPDSTLLFTHIQFKEHVLEDMDSRGGEGSNGWFKRQLVHDGLAKMCLDIMRTHNENFSDRPATLEYSTNNWAHHLRLSSPANLSLFKAYWSWFSDQALLSKWWVSYAYNQLQFGLQPNDSDISMLQVAAMFGLTEFTNEILSYDKRYVENSMTEQKPNHSPPPLGWAIARSDQRAAETLLEAGCKVQSDHLPLAARSGLPMMRLIIEHMDKTKVEIHSAHMEVAFRTAVAAHHGDLIKLLKTVVDPSTKETFKIPAKAFSTAVQNGNNELAIKLLDDIPLTQQNRRDFITWSTLYHEERIIKEVMKRSSHLPALGSADRVGPLNQAISCGCPSLIGQLYSSEAIHLKDRLGLTPFDVAVKYRRTHVLQRLLQDESPDHPVFQPTSATANTAMTIAALRENFDLVDLLVVRGVDLTQEFRFDGWNFLHYAAAHDDREKVDQLIDAGLPINDRMKQDTSDYGLEGDTPLIIAIKKRHTEAVIALATKNADVSLKDAQGRTPMNLAEEFGNEEIVNFLKSRGA